MFLCYMRNEQVTGFIGCKSFFTLCPYLTMDAIADYHEPEVLTNFPFAGAYSLSELRKKFTAEFSSPQVEEI